MAGERGRRPGCCYCCQMGLLEMLRVSQQGQQFICHQGVRRRTKRSPVTHLSHRRSQQEGITMCRFTIKILHCSTSLLFLVENLITNFTIFLPVTQKNNSLLKVPTTSKITPNYSTDFSHYGIHYGNKLPNSKYSIVGQILQHPNARLLEPHLKSILILYS